MGFFLGVKGEGCDFLISDIQKSGNCGFEPFLEKTGKRLALVNLSSSANVYSITVSVVIEKEVKEEKKREKGKTTKRGGSLHQAASL